MKNLRRFIIVIIAMLFVGSNSFAFTCDPSMTTDGTCNVARVTLGSITLLDDDTNLLGSSYNATSCIGLFVGNDGPVSSPNYTEDTERNIGENLDGLLNGQNPKKADNQFYYLSDDTPYFFTGEEFIDGKKGHLTNYGDFQDLDGDGSYTDAGWIHLAEITPSSSQYDLAGPNPYNPAATGIVLNIDDFLDITFFWGDSEYTNGAWELAFNGGEQAIDKVQELLGGATFDHLAFSFKVATYFAVYDFNFNTIFEQETNLNFLTPYVLSGTFNTCDFPNPTATNPQDISHIHVWARDPAGTSVIPEPSTFILLGAGLIGLVAYRRKRS